MNPNKSNATWQLFPRANGDIETEMVQDRGKCAGRVHLPAFSPAHIILAIGIGACVNFADPDLWMHLLVGREILNAGHIPLYNSYSYSGPAQPWHNHVWLAQVLLAMSYDFLGIFGLKILKLSCVSIAVIALATGLSRTKAPPLVQRIVLLAAAAGIAPYAQFRPQLFTIALLSTLIATLAGEVYQGRARLWPLVPMFGLWANLHGGFVVGLGALGVTAMIVGLQEVSSEEKIYRAWRIAGVTLLCAAATLLNPFGWGLWSTVLHSVSHPFIRNVVVDWLSLPDIIVYVWRQYPLHEMQFVVPLVLFGALAVSLVASPDMEDASLAAVALIFIAAAIYSSRNVPLAVIALSIPLARHAGLALEMSGRIESGRAKMSHKRGVLFPLGAAVILAILGGEFSTRLRTWNPVPSGAVQFMKRHHLHGNILNKLSWGAYLIWHGAPADKVFVDGRCEVVYRDSMLQEYMAFIYQWPGGSALLDRYPHDFVLVTPGGGSYRTVTGDRHWKLVYRDAVAALFARTGAAVTPEIDTQPDSGAMPYWFP
jgi:hypothetical protein